MKIAVFWAVMPCHLGKSVLLFQKILLPPISLKMITKTAGSCSIRNLKHQGHRR
jgi:hypothetical protein